MKHSESQLSLPAGSKAAGAKLFYQSWMPDGDAKAVIILAHGYDEHSGRYQHFADHCTARGYAVYAVDHWGHGKSQGINGFVPAFSVYHDGIDQLLMVLPDTVKNLPRFLVGHSLGGLISATHLLDHQSEFMGAVLSGPAIKAAEEPSALLKFISRILSRIMPKLGVIALDAAGVSRDPAVVADYLADPLVSGRKISARLGHEMMNNMNMVQQQAGRITLPLLLLHGGDDRLTAPAGSTYLYDHVGSQQKAIKIYPGLFHEIFNEPEQAMVLTDMTDWLDQQLLAIKG